MSRLVRRRELFVLCVAEAENHHEDWLEENETDSEASAFAERFGKFDVHNDTKHKVSARDDGEEAKHWFHIQNLEHSVSVVNRDESFPAFFASFFEDFPFGNDNENYPSDNTEGEEEAEETGENPCANSWGRSHIRIIG